MKYQYLTQNEILQLNKELMNRGNKSNEEKSSISSIVNKEIIKIKNGEIGQIFEYNIRKTLENEFNLEIADIPRHFYYRIIKHKNKTYIICPTQRISTKKYNIEFDEYTHFCNFIDKKDNNILGTIKEKQTNVEFEYERKLFNIGPPTEIEVDGLYKMNSFSLEELNSDEIEIIFNNSKHENYDYCVIEVKLNQNKIDEVIAQLKDDSKIIDKIIHGNVLYLGIVNLAYENKDISLNILNVDFNNFNCVIIGIRGGIFCDRNVIYPIDWKLIYQFKELKQEINAIEKKINMILEKIK